MTSLLEAELRAQPAALARFLAAAGEEVAAVKALAAGTSGVVVAARGSSDNAARYARYLVPLLGGPPVALATPSLATVYGVAADVRGRLVVAVSQSGSSPDVVSVLRDARAQGAPTLAVTDDPGSALAAQADHVLALRVGGERSVAATGTYTTSLAALALVAAALAPPAPAEALLAALARTPELVGRALDVDVDAAVAVLAASRRGFAIGRGVNLATAHEAALKLTELTGSVVVGHSPADLRHGPIGAAGPGTPTLLVAPDEAASASVLDLAGELGARGAPVVIVAPSATPAHGPRLRLPDGIPGLVSPIVAVVPVQLLAWRLAADRGVDVDVPGGLHKITRTE